MADREIADNRRNWLIGELSSWETLGLVSADQVARILGLYGTADEAARRRGARALLTLSSLAALLVGLAVFLLIGYNWQAMPAGLKLALILAVLLGAQLCAFLLRYRFARRTASEITFFLACLFYGAAIWLVAQVFHVNAGAADGFWWWAVGVLPFALCLDTLLMHALLVVLLGLYAGFSVFGSTGLEGGWLRSLGLPPGGAYSVLPLALPGLLWAYRKNSPGTVALYAPLLAWWVILQPFAWHLVNASPVYLVGCVGGFFLLAAGCHPEGSPMAIPFRFYGALLTTGALVPLSFHAFQKTLQQAGTTAGIMAMTIIAGILAVGASVAAGVYRQRTAGGPISLVDIAVGEVRRRWLPIGVILLMMILSFWNLLVGKALAPTVLANAAMIILALWMMQVGLRDNRGGPFSSGVLLFLLWTVLRYVDLFGDFGGMLGASLMFFLCGTTLFLVAEYWRRRKVVRHA